MTVCGTCQWPTCAVRLYNTCHKFPPPPQKKESYQVDTFLLSLFQKYYARASNTTAQPFYRAFVATVSLHEPAKKAEKVGKKEIQLLPFWRRNTSTVVRHVRHKTHHFLSSVEQKTHTHTHTHRTATLEFPINKVITLRNVSHQNDRWFASWNIKKCLSVEIKCFTTRTVTRNSSELLKYDSSDTTHS